MSYSPHVSSRVPSALTRSPLQAPFRLGLPPTGKCAERISSAPSFLTFKIVAEVWSDEHTRSRPFLLLLLALGWTSSSDAQDGKQQRIADLAYHAEMAHEGGDCPDATTLEDRNVCLNDARVETYKNYTQFFDALREALIQSSPNDANALALDGQKSSGRIPRDCVRCDGQGVRHRHNQTSRIDRAQCSNPMPDPVDAQPHARFEAAVCADALDVVCEGSVAQEMSG